MICGIDNYSIYGIMDGHGSNGHLVSNFIKEKKKNILMIEKYIIKKLAKSVSFLELNNPDKIYLILIYNNYELIRYFFKKVNEELYNIKFDVHFSGTISVLVFKIGLKIIYSNVGDSRAILVKKKNFKNNSNDYKYEFIQISFDHKPNNKEKR